MPTEFVIGGAQGRNPDVDSAYVLWDADGVEYKIKADSTTGALKVSRAGVAIGATLAAVEVKTASYTLTLADHGKLFSTEGAGGAVTFTLPATDDLPTGWFAEFYHAADQDMIVAAGTADTMVAFNELDADSVAFSTTAEQIGAYIKVVKGAALVYVIVGLAAETATPTIAD